MMYVGRIILCICIGLALSGVSWAVPITVRSSVDPSSVFIPLGGLAEDQTFTVGVFADPGGRAGTVSIVATVDARGSDLFQVSFRDEVFAGGVFTDTESRDVSASTLNGIEPEGNATIGIGVSARGEFTSVAEELIDPFAAPEPPTLLLFVLGALSLASYGWTRQRQ